MKDELAAALQREQELKARINTIRLRWAEGKALSALEALGALPEGYCFCQKNRDAMKPWPQHTGECQTARMALSGR